MRGNTTFNASNALYHNEVGDFPDAMRLYHKQIVTEFGTAYEGQPADLRAQDLAYIATSEKETTRATEIYETVVVAARTAAIATAAKMMRDEGMEEFAEALESGDYSRIAM